MTKSIPVSRRQALAFAFGAAGAGLALPLHARTIVPPRPDHMHLTLKTADGREVAVMVKEPKGKRLGTVLFSHGAMSAPWKYEAILEPVVKAGFRILAPLHVDSRDHPRTADFPGLKSWPMRIEDMRLLIDHIGAEPFIAMGHSYGGLVATVMGGAAGVPAPGFGSASVQRLASCVVAFSPPAPSPVLITAKGYAALAVPALIQTGTRDLLPGTAPQDTDAWRNHLAPIDMAASGGNRYGLVLDGVDHYFGGAICDLDRPGPKQTEMLAQANAIVGLFIKAYGQPNRLLRQSALRHLDSRATDRAPVRLFSK